MDLNLFDIYRALLQRARRHPHHVSHQETKTLGRALVAPSATKAQRLKICKRIEAIESNLRVQVSFGNRARRAIESGAWLIDVPYQVRHRWEESDEDYGYLYIASADTRPGELKVGATANSPYDRERSYRARYGYSIKMQWYKFIRTPFALEKLVANSISENRVSGLTWEDSNEWYRHDLDGLIKLVEEIDSQRNATGVEN